MVGPYAMPNMASEDDRATIFIWKQRQSTAIQYAAMNQPPPYPLQLMDDGMVAPARA